MIKLIVLIILVIFFALNMGGSNFSASFASAYGSKVLTRRKARILFGIFVFLGAVLVGKPVTTTLGERIIPTQLITIDTVLIILISASFSMLLANLLHIPQSTSLVTVGALVGVGLYFHRLYATTFIYLVPFWILLPLLGYFLTYFLGRIVYPPGEKNFWVYEKLVKQKGRLKIFVIAASCYNAFSVGTNNVANAVGPLVGANLVNKTLGLALVAPMFGLGSLVFAGPLRTTGEKIIPLGVFTATIICLVTGTIMIIASLLGVPQSFVMVKVASVFAIHGLKNGHKLTLFHPVTRKTYLTWIVSPLMAVIISYFLTGANYALFK